MVSPNDPNIVSQVTEQAQYSWETIINFELIRGNNILRFAIVLVVIIISMAIARILQFVVNCRAVKLETKEGATAWSLSLHAVSKPIYVIIFGLGIISSKLPLYFNDQLGIRSAIGDAWLSIGKVVVAIGFSYGLYRLVDVIEHFLTLITSKTETKLDDMLVPVLRKSLRITITILAVLFIAENVLGADRIKSLILGAGVGGIAIALAAKDTIANFFGSLMIFTDRPFQIDDLVKIAGHYGAVEEVGFRSTRLRTLQGHWVTLPNSIISSEPVENVGKRPFIRRNTDITITYDTGHDKTEQAVQYIKDILEKVPQINVDPDRPPRVYFNEFNSDSLNIYISYWVKPADWWTYCDVNEQVNFAIFKKFNEEKIEFAFPTQTLYLKKDNG